MKTWLIILGIAILAMGIWGAVPSWHNSWVSDPLWYAIIKIAAGIFTLGVAYSDKKAE